MGDGSRAPLRIAIVAMLVFALACAAAAPAGAVRSKRGAKPSITILTKDQRAALRTQKLSLRVGVGIAPARIRLRGLGLDLSRRPIRIVNERKVRFRGAHSRTINLTLTKEARRLIQAARDACRNVRISAFASARRLGVKRDDQRTTLVRHSKTLRHRGTSCGGDDGFGSPGSVTLPPGFGDNGPGGGGPGTGPPPVFDPNEPVTIRAGTASQDITPPVGTPMFAYTARSQVFGPSEDKFLQLLADPDENFYAKSFAASRGIHTRVLSRAIVIESGGNKFALVHVDLGGIPYAMTQEVLKRIGQTGITGDRLLLSATHTHSSSGAIWSAENMGYGFVGGDVYDPRIFDIIAGAIARSIIDADALLAPARIGVGTAELRGASRNRNFDPPFRRNTDVPQDEAGARAVSIDPRVTVIRVDDVAGRPLGAWSNFAIHPTSFGDENLLFSGDNASTTERFVEEAIALDGDIRGARPIRPPVNVWTNAAEGDISPDGDADVDPTLPGGHAQRALDYRSEGFGAANIAGRRVASGIFAAWVDAGQALRGSPTIDVRRTFMTFDGSMHGGEPVGPVPVLGFGGIAPSDDVTDGNVKSDGFCAPAENFAGVGQGHKFPLLSAPGAVPNIHPVSLMRVGPLAIAAFPSEITTQAGRRIRAAIEAKTAGQAPEGTIIAGLTNSYNSYTATPEEYEACYYEGSFTLWGRQQATKYRDLADQLADALYGGGNLPMSVEPPQTSPAPGQPPSVRRTPDAGTVVKQPVNSSRTGQVEFKWNGGDPAVDAARGLTFVRLERRIGGDFDTVATEDSLYDTTSVVNPSQTDRFEWTHKFEFHECVPLGTYRFVVSGTANKAGTVAPYPITSQTFEVGRSTGLKSVTKEVSGTTARVRAEYGGVDGSKTLTALPRRVRSGFAILRVRAPGRPAEEVIAPIDSGRLEFVAAVPNGSTVDVVSVEDACGNTGS